MAKKKLDLKIFKQLFSFLIPEVLLKPKKICPANEITKFNNERTITFLKQSGFKVMLGKILLFIKAINYQN